MRLLAINPPKISTMAESLPIRMGKPLALSMSTVFGRRQEMVSKSWSDMWDEDEEEQELAKQNLKELNNRSWSQESKEETENTEEKIETHDIHGDIDDDLLADGFFFQEAPVVKTKPSTEIYSPPSKRNHIDKWAALGERRKGQNKGRNIILDGEKSPETKARRHFGFGFKSYEAGVLDHYNYQHKSQQAVLGKDKGGAKDCPWNKGRDWTWRRDRRNDLGDVEWVGGW